MKKTLNPLNFPCAIFTGLKETDVAKPDSYKTSNKGGMHVDSFTMVVAQREFLIVLIRNGYDYHIHDYECQSLYAMDPQNQKAGKLCHLDGVKGDTEFPRLSVKNESHEYVELYDTIKSHINDVAGSVVSTEEPAEEALVIPISTVIVEKTEQLASVKN